jgi:hypothetical protein
VALPEGGPDVPWPPAAWKSVYDRYNEHSAWFSGDPAKLIQVYLGAPVRTSVWRTNFDRFWARGQAAPQRRQMLHAPMAGDISTTSGDLLYAEPPDFVARPPSGQAKKGKTSGGIQDRLDYLREEMGIIQTLNESGELASALGGDFLRVTWDKELQPDHPLLTSVNVDNALPDFRWGQLTAVIFWDIVQEDPKEGGKQATIWRKLERHAPGIIETGLYQGSTGLLGERVPLSTMPQFANLADELDTEIEYLTAVYVPNMRPNRLFRGTPLGRSDYDGIEAFMDALDEVWTSWMRDLRLARARLIVPQEFMQSAGKGKGSQFDIDQEIWEALPMMPPEGDKMITPSQFAIRTKEHLETAMALVERIVSAAGYAAATFGLHADKTVAATATEITNRERRTFITRAKKINYSKRPLQEILQALLAIDSAHFKIHDVLRPSVDWPDSIQSDPKENATIVQLLEAANSASTETRVRMVHGDWSDDEVKAEVTKILDEGLVHTIPAIAPETPENAPTTAPAAPPGAPVAPKMPAMGSKTAPNGAPAAPARAATGVTTAPAAAGSKA